MLSEGVGAELWPCVVLSLSLMWVLTRPSVMSFLSGFPHSLPSSPSQQGLLWRSAVICPGSFAGTTMRKCLSGKTLHPQGLLCWWEQIRRWCLEILPRCHRSSVDLEWVCAAGLCTRHLICSESLCGHKSAYYFATERHKLCGPQMYTVARVKSKVEALLIPTH